MAHKTKRQREEEYSRAFDAFLRDLGRVQTFQEAVQFAHGSIRHAPAKQCYSNLAFFLGQGMFPDGATEDELRAYVELWTRIPEAKEGSAERLQSAFVTRFPNASVPPSWRQGEE